VIEEVFNGFDGRRGIMEVALCKTGKPEKKWIFMHLMEKQLTLELSGEGE